MINPFNETNWRPDADALRAFGRSLMVGFPILAVVFSLAMAASGSAWVAWPWWMGGIGCVSGALFLAVPVLARPVYPLWFGVACCIGFVVSNVVLALVFYLVVTPVGLLLRLFGKDPMRRKLDPGAATYWTPVETADDPQHYFRQY